MTTSFPAHCNEITFHLMHICAFFSCGNSVFIEYVLFPTITAAPQLAKQGMNVVIMSRSKTRLDQVAREIGTASTCLLYCLCFASYLMYLMFVFSSFAEETTEQRVKVIVTDFANENIFSEIEEQLKDLNIGVLGELSVAHPWNCCSTWFGIILLNYARPSLKKDVIWMGACVALKPEHTVPFRNELPIPQAVMQPRAIRDAGFQNKC